MQFALRLTNTVLIVFSGIAFGVLAMTGVVAGVLFPTMHTLNPTLPAYGAYSGAHWSLAAGIIAERIFDIGFVIVGVSFGICWSSVLVLVFMSRRYGFPVLRLMVLGVVSSIFLFHIGSVQPAMNRAATAYRAAALAGDTERAAQAKARFDALHPTASNLIISSTMGMLALFLFSTWAASGGAGVLSLSAQPKAGHGETGSGGDA